MAIDLDVLEFIANFVDSIDYLLLEKLVEG